MSKNIFPDKIWDTVKVNDREASPRVHSFLAPGRPGNQLL